MTDPDRIVARTTFMPWNPIDMGIDEYRALLREGLIVLDDAPTEPADGTQDGAPAAPPADEDDAPVAPDQTARLRK